MANAGRECALLPQSGRLVFLIGVGGMVLRSISRLGSGVGEELSLQAIELLAVKQAAIEH
jgi:hypothetical protein